MKLQKLLSWKEWIAAVYATLFVMADFVLLPLIHDRIGVGGLSTGDVVFLYITIPGRMLVGTFAFAVFVSFVAMPREPSYDFPYWKSMFVSMLTVLALPYLLAPVLRWDLTWGLLATLVVSRYVVHCLVSVYTAGAPKEPDGRVQLDVEVLDPPQGSVHRVNFGGTQHRK